MFKLLLLYLALPILILIYISFDPFGLDSCRENWCYALFPIGVLGIVVPLIIGLIHILKYKNISLKVLKWPAIYLAFPVACLALLVTHEFFETIHMEKYCRL